MFHETSAACTGAEVAICTKTQEPDASVVNLKIVILPEPLNPEEHSAAFPEVGETEKVLEILSKAKTCGLLQLVPCEYRKVVKRQNIAKMANFTGLIGLRIEYDHKVRNQNYQRRVETIELWKIDHKYSETRVNLPVEATIINLENRRRTF